MVEYPETYRHKKSLPQYSLPLVGVYRKIRAADSVSGRALAGGQPRMRDHWQRFLGQTRLDIKSLNRSCG